MKASHPISIHSTHPTGPQSEGSSRAERQRAYHTERKRIKIFLALLVLAAAFVSVAAMESDDVSESDAGATFTYDGMTYEIIDNEPPTVKLITGKTGNVVVPDTVRYNNIDYTVTAIHDESFTGRAVTSIKTGEHISYIGGKAFKNCTSLRSISIPSVVNIWNSSFEGCTALSSVTISSNLLNIYPYAFKNCSTLSTFTWEGEKPEVNIYAQAFFNCSNLTNPNFIVKSFATRGGVILGESAFYNCSKLTTLELDFDSLVVDNTNLVDRISGLTALTTLKAPNLVLDMTKTDQEALLKGYSNLQVLEIKMSSIPADYFKTFSKLTTVTINGATSIGNNAFESCPAVSSFTSNSITSVGNNAFKKCSVLTTFNAPNATSIGGSAFEACSALTTMTVSSDLSSIGSYCFKNCNNLANFTTGSSNPSVSVGQQAFWYCSKLISVPFYLSSVSNNSFIGCSALTSITVKGSVTTIGNLAFQNCTALQHVYRSGDQSAGVSIGTSAFEGCEALAYFDFPNVASVGNYAFKNCHKLTSIDLSHLTATSIGTQAFWACDVLSGSIILPSNVTTVNEGAFNYCWSITEVRLPGVTSIGNYAFDHCNKINKVEFSSSLNTLGTTPFSVTFKVDTVTKTSVSDLKGFTWGKTTGQESGTVLRKVTQLTYDNNGGTGTMTGRVIEMNVGYTLPASTFTKTDYSFMGWNTDSSSLQVSYMDKGSVTPTGTTLVLKAVWYEKIPVPKGKNLSYTGEEQEGVDSSDKYTREDHQKTDSGSYTAKVTPIIGYAWENGATTARNVAWTISKAYASNWTITGISDKEYTGSALTPTPTVKFNDIVVEGTSNYDVVYSNNTYVGTSTVTITAKNTSQNFTGTVSKTFKIVAKPITVTPLHDSLTYGDNVPTSGFDWSITAGELASGDELSGTVSYNTNYTKMSSVGSYQINMSGLSNPNYKITFGTGSLEVNKKSINNLTSSGTMTKVYDCTTSMVGSYGGLSVSSSDIISGDSVTFTVTNVAAYDSADVGSEYTVTATVSMSGTDSGNYLLSNNTVQVNAEITKRPINAITVSGTATKVYDGTKTAPSTEGLTVSSTDILSGDTVTFTVTGLSAYGSASVGASYQLNATVEMVESDDSTNYSLVTTVAPAAASITKKEASVAVTGTVTKVYDATLAAPSGYASMLTLTPTGIVGNDNVRFAVSSVTDYTNKAVGDYSVTANITMTGADSGNYTLTTSSVGDIPAKITKATLVPAVTGTATKIYDGTAGAPEVTGLTPSVSGKIGEDAVEISISSLTDYSSASVGSYKLTATVAVSGDDAGNYELSSTTVGNVNATVTKATITVTPTVASADVTVEDPDTNKVFLGENVTLGFTSSGFVNGETWASVLGSQAPGLSTTYAAGSPAGDYTAVADISNLSAANYRFSKVDTPFTVQNDYREGHLFQVILVTNGGTFPTMVDRYKYRTGVSLPRTPSTAPKGYQTEENSVNWYDNPAFTGTAVNAISDTDTGDKTLYAKYTQVDYTITGAAAQTGGSISAVATAHYGDEVTITVTLQGTYSLGSLSYTPEGGSAVTIPITNPKATSYTFSMPDSNITLAFTCVASQYTVSTTPAEGVTITPSNPPWAEDSTITLAVVVEAGYAATNLAYNGTILAAVVTSGNYQFTMPAANVTVTCTSTPIDYTVSVTQTAGATVTASKTTAAHVGDVITLTASAFATGKEIGAFTGATVTKVSDTEFTFVMPASDVGITYTVVDTQYNISVISATGATVTSPTNAVYGSSVTLGVSGLETGNELKTLKFNSTDIPMTDPAAATQTFTMPAEDVIITYSVGLTEYDVEVTTVTGATVSSSSAKATYGQSVTLTITPATGYKVDSITYSGTTQQNPGQKVTFTMPADKVSVTYVCSKIPYAISLPSSLPTGISSMSASVDSIGATTARYGDVVTVSVVPIAGYQVTSLTWDGMSATYVSDTEYIFTMPAREVSVAAVAEKVNYPVTVVQIPGNTISSSVTTAQLGDSVTLTVALQTGYQLATLAYNDGSDHPILITDPLATSYSFSMPAAGVTVSYTVSKCDYRITLPTPLPTGVSGISAKVGGNSSTTANYRDEVTLDVSMQTGYRLTSLEYNGHSIGLSNNTFTMPATDVAITCTVTMIDYDITINSVIGATVVASKAPANYGDIITLSILLDTGYQLDSITASYTGGQVELSGSGNTRQFTMPSGGVTVNYAVSKVQYSVVLPDGVVGLKSITASETAANYNDEIVLTITPSEGYKLDSVSVNGVGISIDGAIVFSMPDATATVSCSLSKMTYAINVIASDNATVLAVPTSATFDDTVNLTITLSTGYQIKTITATDSSSQEITLTPTSAGYKFTMPASDVTVVYTSEKIGYGITVSTGDYIGAPANANYNSNVVLTKNLPAGYQLDWVKYSYGQNEYTVDLGSMSFSMPDSAITVTYGVSKIVYDVNIVSSNGATVVASSVKAVIDNQINVTISLDTGFRLTSINAIYAGGEVELTGTDNTRQFTMPAGSVSISYEADMIDYDVSLGEHTGASVTAIIGGATKSLNTVANFGDTVEVVATAESGYRVDSVSYSYNNATYAAERTQSGNYVFTMPLDAVSISVSCSMIPFNVSVDNTPVGASVKIEDLYDSVSNKYSGNEIQLTVDLQPGYKLSSLVYNDGSDHSIQITDPLETSYSFFMPANNVIVTYECGKIEYNIAKAALPAGITSLTVVGKAGYGDNVTVEIELEDDYNVSSLYYYEGTDQSTTTNLTMTSGNTASFNMPLSDIMIVCSAAKNLHSITILGVEGLTITADKASETEGETVTLTVSPSPGYSLDTITVFYTAQITTDNPKRYEIPLPDTGNTRTFTMPSYDVTVDATSSLVNYQITKSSTLPTGVSEMNVTVDGQTPSPLEAHISQSITVAVKVQIGYAVDWLKVNGGDALVPFNVDTNNDEYHTYEYVFAMPASDINITSSASKTPHVISIVDTTGATISSSVQSAFYDDQITLAVGYAIGYKLTALQFNNGSISIGTGQEASYQFNMPDEDVSITYTCEMIEYPLTVFKSDHATVTANKIERLTYEETVQLTVTLDTGYQLDSLRLNDVPITITNPLAKSYSFNMPAAAVALTYECGKIDYSVSKATDPAGITLELNKESANYMESVTVSATVQPGYKLDSLQYSNSTETWNVDISSNSTLSYSFNMPSSNVTVTATSSKVERTITVDNGTGVTANLSKTSGIYVGDSISFTLSLLTGYTLESLTVTYNDGAATPPQLPYTVDESTYTFTMPGYDTKITVRAEQIPYDVSVITVAGATVTVNDSSSEKYSGWHFGETVRLIVDLTPGYRLDSMFFGGTSIPLSSPVSTDPLEYRIAMPNENVTLSYECSYLYYDVSVVKVNGAGVTPSQQNAHVGERIMLNVSADTGYELSTVTVTSGETPITVTKIGDSVYRFDMPAGRAVVNYTVAKIDYDISVPGNLPASGIESITAQVKDSQAVKANYKDSVLLLVTPSTGYQVNWVKVNGIPATSTDDGFLFTMPAAKANVTASASLIGYDISITNPNKGGTLSSPPTATYGTTVYLTLALDTGYWLPSNPVITYGTEQLTAHKDSDTTYSFSMPASNVTCTFDPKKIDYEVSLPESIAGGAISVQSIGGRTTDLGTGNYGDTVVLSVAPNAGYRVDWVKYNGTLIQPNREAAGYSFIMPADKATVTCAFTYVDYHFSLIAPAGVTITADPSPAHIGDTVTFDLTIAEGYSFNGITAKDSDNNDVPVNTIEESSRYTLQMPASSVTVTVAAAALEYTVSFESNGGTNVPAQVIRHGETVTQPSDPTRASTSTTAYTFDGWFSDEELESPYDFTAPVTEVLTLYAKWLESDIPQPVPPQPSPGGGGGGGSTPTPTPEPEPSSHEKYEDDQGNTHEKYEESSDGWDVKVEKIDWTDGAETTTATVTSGDTESAAVIHKDEEGNVTAEMSSVIKTDASSTVSGDAIAEALSAAEAAAKAIGADVSSMGITVDATTESGTSTAVEISIDLSSYESLSSVTVKSDVGTMTLDSASMSSILEKGTDVTISISHANENDLTVAQKAAANGQQIYDVKALAGSETITTFGGTVKLSLPYTLKSGENPDHVAIYFVDDNAKVEKVGGTYKDGFVTCELEHFSYYFTWNEYSETEQAEGISSMVLVAVAIAAVLILAYMGYMYSRRD